MRKTFLLLALVALVCWLPGQALANNTFVPYTTYDSSLNYVTCADPGFDTSLASYGTVHVALNAAGDIAKVTITPFGESPDFDFHWSVAVGPSVGIYSAFLNVNAGSFTEDALPDPWTSYVGTFSPDSLGTFNLAAANQLFGNVDALTITLTNTSGTWGNADEVLIANAAGFDAAAWLVQDQHKLCNPSGYVGEMVPLPGALLLLGGGLVRLTAYARRKRRMI